MSIVSDHGHADHDNQDDAEFMAAVRDYQAKSGRPVPTFSDLAKTIKAAGSTPASVQDAHEFSAATAAYRERTKRKYGTFRELFENMKAMGYVMP